MLPRKIWKSIRPAFQPGRNPGLVLNDIGSSNRRWRQLLINRPRYLPLNQSTFGESSALFRNATAVNYRPDESRSLLLSNQWFVPTAMPTMQLTDVHRGYNQTSMLLGSPRLSHLVKWLHHRRNPSTTASNFVSTPSLLTNLLGGAGTGGALKFLLTAMNKKMNQSQHPISFNRLLSQNRPSRGFSSNIPQNLPSLPHSHKQQVSVADATTATHSLDNRYQIASNLMKKQSSEKSAVSPVVDYFMKKLSSSAAGSSERSKLLMDVLLGNHSPSKILSHFLFSKRQSTPPPTTTSVPSSLPVEHIPSTFESEDRQLPSKTCYPGRQSVVFFKYRVLSMISLKRSRQTTF